MTNADLLAWLTETDAQRLQMLWAEADRVRSAHVGALSVRNWRATA